MKCSHRFQNKEVSQWYIYAQYIKSHDSDEVRIESSCLGKTGLILLGLQTDPWVRDTLTEQPWGVSPYHGPTSPGFTQALTQTVGMCYSWQNTCYLPAAWLGLSQKQNHLTTFDTGSSQSVKTSALPCSLCQILSRRKDEERGARNCQEMKRQELGRPSQGVVAM